MWLNAFPVEIAISLEGVILTVLSLGAMVISIVAFAKALGSQYELRGSRAGLFLAAAGILAYLVGTSLQNDILHLLSVALFYWGGVLYLGGIRSLVSALPCGLIVMSLFIPRVSRVWGLPYVEGLSWAVIVTSAFVLLNPGKSKEPLGCGLCASFKERGRGFCGSCGRLLGPTTSTVSRKTIAGFAVVTVAMLALLTYTVPMLSVAPGTSFVNVGLGGAQSSSPAPVPGWGVKAAGVPGSGQPGTYTLTNGRTSIQAYVFTSSDPRSAASALIPLRGKATNSSGLPASIAAAMSGYTVRQHGTDYVGLQGVFQVGMLNGSRVSTTFVAVDLKEASASFRADNGSALYGASKALIGWASTSQLLTPTVAVLLSAYQFFAQEALLCSLAIAVVVLFTVARDDELAKERRLESSHALTGYERSVLRAFDSGPQMMTGEQLQGLTKEIDPNVSDAAFYSSLEDVSRRDLVSPSVIVRAGRPTLLWKCLLK